MSLLTKEKSLGKSCLIVKDDNIKRQAERIFGSKVNITADGQRHLGAVIGSQEYKGCYCKDKVNSWVSQLKKLCDFAKTQP